MQQDHYASASSAAVQNLPHLIVCIDLDNNMIGDIKCQVCEWDLIQKFEPSKIRLMRENLKTQLSQSILVRPGLKHFLVSMEAAKAELFVYTASDKRWANFFIPILEDVLGFRFHRPLFTRVHCVKTATGMLQKSLKQIESTIASVLRKKYKGVGHGQGHGIDRAFVQKHTLLIDNTYVLCPNERHRMIKSWSYNYAYESDVLRWLSESVVVRHLKDILKIMKRYHVHPISISSHSNYEDFRMMYYTKLAQDIQHSLTASHAAFRDDFWVRLTKAVLSLPSDVRYKDKSIRIIQSMVHPSKSS